MAYQIVLISSGQPSANPRLVKEAIALFLVGYEVKVIYCPLSPWADPHDEQLFQLHPNIQWCRVGYHPKHQPIGYGYARIRQKAYQYLYRYLGIGRNRLVKSMVLFSQELIKAGCLTSGDVYIGHNLGALPAVVLSAQRKGAKAIFDFEDFHRGEAEKGSQHWNMCTCLENTYVPKLHAATAASALITEAYQALYPSLAITTINNCFLRSYAQHKLPEVSTEQLELFWFSQTIGLNRGLEQVIRAMGLAESAQIRLTLLGNCSADIQHYFVQLANNSGLKAAQLRFLMPVSEAELVQIASTCHVGIASEIPATENRNICLTNKIFIYLLAGNAILFSQTESQELFWQQHPAIGSMYPQQNDQALAHILNRYVQQKDLLQEQRAASYTLAQTVYYWEKECQQLVQWLEPFMLDA